jgi:protein FrlC
VGYDGIDIWGGRPHVYRQDYSVEQLQQLRQQIADHGLDVVSFMPAFYRYPHSLSSPNPVVRSDSIQYMRECIDSAAILGAPVVLVIPDHSLAGQDRADALHWMTESIHVLAEYAGQYNGLKLGLEVLHNDETDFLNSSEDALGMINQSGHDNIGVVLDTGTLNLSREPLAHIFDTLNSLILQIHANDNQGGDHQQNLIPGDGTYDFAGLIQFLKARRYDGYISTELTKGYAADPEPALRLAAQRLRRWMQS